jgi:hypothetical protein
VSDSGFINSPLIAFVHSIHFSYTCDLPSLELVILKRLLDFARY